MIAHALHILVNEVKKYFEDEYGVPMANNRVIEGNIGMGVNGPNAGNVPADRVILTLVNYKEEKTLKNLPNYTKNDTTLRVSYENQPVYLNYIILMTATHSTYVSALIDLSRVIRYFQSKNVFTHDNVTPASLTPDSGDIEEADHLESFKLILDLYSPSFEEINHLWGTLGGKQYPFLLYIMRALDLKFRSIQSESGLITEIVNDFSHKSTP